MSADASSALAVVEPSNSLEANVGVLMRRATDVAGVCREIVMKTAQSIQGRKYVRVEGWQSIAVAYGCVLSARDVEAVPGGIRAIGEVRRMSDGVVIATADGFVGDDEKTWASRPMYARRAMAQTRAQSRAGRTAFSFVVTLIDGNLATTPAEEMDGITNGTVEPPPPAPVRGTAGLKAALDPKRSPPQSIGAAAERAANEPPPHEDADFRPSAPPHDATTGEVRSGVFPTVPPKHDRTFVMPFANKDQKQLHELSEKDLAWFKKTLATNIDDPDKRNFIDSNRQRLALIDAERAFRGL